MHSEPEYSAAESVIVDVSWVVTRATRAGRAVLLRRSSREHPTSHDLAKLRYGANLVQSLDLPGVVRVLDVERDGEGVAVVLEDFGGLPLRRLLAQRRIEVLEALTIARELTKILGALRRERVIHRDVAPANIYVDAATGAVKLANFDNASRLDHERPVPVPASQIDGTLAYISPEQTGRMNRDVDYRTDMYSLGVTLYEMLAGRPPFDAADPMALLNSHLAVVPEPPHRIRPTVDAAVSALVMKLLAKNAEDRYQTTYGLLADLEECSSQLATMGTIGDFIPGAHDVASELHVSGKLRGREREIESLFALFERATSGNAELAILSGRSGTGKSTLARELHRPVTARRGYFTSGKFDRVHNTPHAAILEALRGLIRELLAEGDKKLASLRKRLPEALGASGQVILDLLPEVAQLVGEQPPLPPADPLEEQNRFNLVFLRFIHVFTRREHPLVIVLEDLQWADSASLRLIRLLLSDPSTRHLLIVGTYRDDAIHAAHPLSQALAALRTERGPFPEIALQNLDAGDVRGILVDTLGCPDDEDARALADVLHDRTEGNPFSVHRAFSWLSTHQLLTFSADAGRREWDLQRIQEASLLGDFAGQLAEQTGALPAAAQRALQLASCLGASFDLDTLAIISERPRIEVASDLETAIQSGLLLPIGDDYKYLSSSAAVAEDAQSIHYEFLHDRAREALYDLLPAEAAKALHLGIGRRLEAGLSEAAREARLFEIVNHLDLGADLLEGAEARSRMAQLNLASARRAALAIAHDAALRYLAVATRLLAPEDRSLPDLTFSIHLLRAECEHMLGHFGAAKEAFQAALAAAATIEETARVHALEVAAHLSRGNHDGMLRSSRAALALYGVEVPAPEKVAAAHAEESARLDENLAGRPLAELVHLPEATDPASRARTTILSRDLAYVSYFDPNLFSLFAMKLVNESLEHGVSPGSSIGYVTHAATLGVRTGDYARAHAFGEVALGLAERLDGVNLRSRVEVWFGAYVNPWSSPAGTSYPYLERSYAALLENGSQSGAGISAVHSIYLAILAGDELQALQERALRHYQAQSRFTLFVNAQVMSCFLRMITLLTQGSIPRELSAQLGEQGLIGRPSAYHVVHFTRELLDLIVAFLFGDLERALACATRGASYLHFAFGLIAEVEFHFFRALVMAALLPTSAPEEREGRLALFAEDREKLAQWAAFGTASFVYKYDLVRAEESRIVGDTEAAMGFYDAAIDAAAEQEITHHEAMAAELAAKFYLARGRRKIARAYLADARQAYLRWGATAKVAALDAEHPGLLPGAGQSRRAGDSRPGAAPDILAVLKASQSLSREIVLDDLLHRLMSNVLEISGAQRGLLLLKGDHEIIVEAGSGVEAILVTDANIDDRVDVSRAIVRCVERTRERIVLGDAANSGQFRSDPYVATARPKSILCVPVLSHQQLIGVLYLENNLTTCAFTPERCKVLSLLTAQAAISLENARLQDLLKGRLKERTQELSASNEELSLTLRRLKDTQKQLIAQEKLASLGALTSGIAHEIKNPLNLINNFAELSVGLAGDLLQEIEAQRARLEPDSVAAIDEIVSDLQQNAAKINQHGRRADDIVRAMLEHSRSGKGERREVDVNALLGEYVNLAYQGFRSQDPAFNVAIETAYDPAVGALLLPTQEIGRVFLNLINNACYAARAQRQRKGLRFSPVIQVATKDLGDRVEIRVRDNGAGIPASVREKVFNPFFTTKPPGEGTGLGLSISHEIIQSNGGTLAFDTAEGLYTELIITLPRRTG